MDDDSNVIDNTGNQYYLENIDDEQDDIQLKIEVENLYQKVEEFENMP